MNDIGAQCRASAPGRMALWDTLLSKYYLPRAVTGDDYFDDSHANRVTRWLVDNQAGLPRSYVTMLAKFTANCFDAEVEDWFALSDESLEDGVRVVSRVWPPWLRECACGAKELTLPDWPVRGYVRRRLAWPMRWALPFPLPTTPRRFAT